jgi:hypothetical protein
VRLERARCWALRMAHTHCGCTITVGAQSTVHNHGSKADVPSPMHTADTQEHTAVSLAKALAKVLGTVPTACPQVDGALPGPRWTWEWDRSEDDAAKRTSWEPVAVRPAWESFQALAKRIERDSPYRPPDRRRESSSASSSSSSAPSVPHTAVSLEKALGAMPMAGPQVGNAEGIRTVHTVGSLEGNVRAPVAGEHAAVPPAKALGTVSTAGPQMSNAQGIGTVHTAGLLESNVGAPGAPHTAFPLVKALGAMPMAGPQVGNAQGIGTVHTTGFLESNVGAPSAPHTTVPLGKALSTVPTAGSHVGNAEGMAAADAAADAHAGVQGLVQNPPDTIFHDPG